MGGGEWINQAAQTAYAIKHSIPSDCPEPDWGTWEALINLWIVRFGGGSLVGGAVLGWLILGGVLFSKPINKLMERIVGFTLEDLRNTVKRRKERDSELKKGQE